jgi:hypothetical protein
MRFSCLGELKSPVPTHEPVHRPEMSAPFDVMGAGVTAGAGDGVVTTGADEDVLAGGVLAGGALEGEGLGDGSGVAATGVSVSSIRGSAGATALSAVAAAVSVPDGVSARVADGSEELKTEHAARRGIIASTSSTRIEPP